MQHITPNVLVAHTTMLSRLTESSSLHIDERGKQLSCGDSRAVILSTYSPEYVEDFFSVQSFQLCAPLSSRCTAWFWRDQTTFAYLFTTVRCRHGGPKRPRLAAQSSKMDESYSSVLINFIGF